MNFGKLRFSRALRVARFGLFGAAALASTAYAVSVAKIGDAEYESLDAAIAAAQSGDTVTLLADATLGVDSIANDITLDTAGHDMTVAGQVYLYIDGNVVFTNSAYNAADPTASGVVRVTTYGVCPYTGGSLTIANGRYEQIVAENHLFYTMGGSLVINDGSFDASNSVVNTYVRSDGIPTGFGGTVTVNGGDFHVGDTSPYTIIRANQGATVTINGGNFDADGGYVMISATVAGNSAAPASIAVNGGTFADGAIISANDTSIAIADGAFTQIELASCDDSSIAIGDGLFKQTELTAWDDSSIAISGGLFDFVVPEALCAEGCIPSTETTTIDGVEYYTVKQGSYVAQIVIGATTNKYESLASAIAAVPADGTATTIEMIEDVAVTNVAHTIAAGQNIILDLNGKTIDGFCNTGANFAFITNNGTLVIQDSSDAEANGTGDGKILFNASPYSGTTGSTYYSDLIVNHGVLTVKSGFLKNNTAGAIAYAIDDLINGSGDSVTIEGGSLSASTGVRLYVQVGGSNHAFTMTGGTLTGRDGISMQGKGAGTVNVAISGGTINGISIDVPYSISTSGSSTLNLSISGDAVLNGGIYAGNTSTINVTGGTLNAKSADYPYSIMSGGSAAVGINISDGVLNGGIYAASGSTVDISGGTFNVSELAPSGTYIFFYTGSTASISGGTFSAKVYAYDSLEISDGSFIASVYAYDALDITGGTFGDWVYVYDPANTSISGGRFYCIYDAAGSTDGFITGGVHKYNSTYWTEHVALGYVMSANTGADAASYPWSVGGAKAMVVSVPDASTGACSTNYCASVINAVGTATAGKTVVMLDDETLSTNVVVTTDITLDLAGHAIERTGVNTKEESSSFVVDGATFTVTNSTGSGLISNVSKGYTIYVKNDGVLNVQDGTISGPSYAIHAPGTSSSAATVNVSGGTVSSASSYAINMLGVAAAHPVALSVTGGTVSGGNAGIYVKYGSVDVSGGNVTSTSDYGYGMNVNGYGTATVSGGAISGGYGAVSIGASTASASISGGTLTGGTTAVRAGGGDATITGGTLTGGTSALEIGNANSDVAVSGGQFSGGTSIVALTKGTASFSGGVYSIAPATEYVAEGYTVTDNADAETAAAYPYTVMPATPTCTIRWMAGDTVVKSVSVTNGTPAAEIAALAPIGANSSEGNARFVGWSPAVYADALGDADYIAQFEAIDFLAGIVPGTLHFTSIKANGRKVAVTFEFKPTGGETDAYRLIYKTAIDSAETFVSDIANVTLISGDENSWTATAEVILPEGCEAQAFVTGLDFTEKE